MLGIDRKVKIIIFLEEYYEKSVEIFPELENLPEEIKTEIFSYLNQNSLKSAASVNKNWRSNVFGSNRLLKKAKMRVHDFQQQKTFIKTTGKRFRAVCIKIRRMARIHIADQNFCLSSEPSAM
jgi:hypothetical protein